MKTTVAKANQSSLDLVIMACGTMEGAMQIMAANQQSLSNNPWVYTEYVIPDDIITDTSTLDYLAQNKITAGNLVIMI